jgi:PEP-CTERM motif
MKNSKKSLAFCVGVLAVGAASSQAQTVLGSFQGASDPTDAGWINQDTGNAITADSAMSFVAAGVTGYAQSLQITGAGYNGADLQLGFSPAQIAAFNANTILSFTFAVPASTSTSGYSQIYSMSLNAPGYGYNNIPWASTTSVDLDGTDNNSSGEPNYYWGPAGSERSETISFNYSSILPSIIAGGESYLQLRFTPNNGGGAPNYWYMNNVVLTSPVPEPTTLALAGLGGLASLVALRRKK